MAKQFLIKNTMADMRNLCACEITELEDGTYLGVQLLGYYQAGDTPDPIIYYPSNLTRSDDGGSFIVANGIKLIHAFGGEIDIRYFGAKGDDIFDNAEVFNRIFIHLAPKSTLIVSKGIYKTSYFKISAQAYHTKFLGYSRRSSIIKCLSDEGIGIGGEECYFENLTLVGLKNTTGGDVNYRSYILKDARDNGTADFDIYINNCQLENSRYAVLCNGRGVNITDCGFYGITAAIIRIEFPYNFVPGPENIQTQYTGFRGVVFERNRVHYTETFILENTGANKTNLRGVSIQNNWFEGAVRYVRGPLNDFVCKNNLHYHFMDESFAESIFSSFGGENIDIDLSISTLKEMNVDGVVTKTHNIFRIMTSVYPINRMKFVGTFENVKEHSFFITGGIVNSEIKVNAENISLADKSFSLIRLNASPVVANPQSENLIVSGFVNGNNGDRVIDRGNYSLTNLHASHLNVDSYKQKTNVVASDVTTDWGVHRELYGGQATLKIVDVKNNIRFAKLYKVNNVTGITQLLTRKTDSSAGCPGIVISGNTINLSGEAIETGFTYTLEVI